MRPTVCCLLVLLFAFLVSSQKTEAELLKSLNDGIMLWNKNFQTLANQSFSNSSGKNLSRRDIDASIDLAFEFLMRMQAPDGAFREAYTLKNSTFLNGTKKLLFREAAAMWSLSRLWVLGQRGPLVTNALDRAVKYFLDMCSVTPTGNGLYIRNTNESVGDIGAVSFLLATLADLSTDPSRAASYMPHISKLMVFVMSMLDDSGIFFFNYNPATGDRLALSTPFSYSGQGSSVAFMALVKVIRQIQAYKDLYSLLPPLEATLFKYWIGAERSVKEARQAGFQEYYLTSIRYLFQMSLSQSRVLDSFGSIVHALNFAYNILSARATRVPTENTVSEVEGLINAYHIGYALGLENVIAALKKYIPVFSRNIMKYQYGGPGYAGVALDSFARGGCLRSLNGSTVHLSTTQHHLHTLLILKMLAD